MPCLGRFHFYYENSQQLFVESFVSMPCLGRFHFYVEFAVKAALGTVCQCPASGDFISTEYVVRVRY